MGLIGEMLFYAGAIQGALLSVFLFSIKANRISNRLLGLLTFLWALLLLQFPLQAHGLYIDHPHLLKTISSLLFALFPLLYLHVKYLLADYKKFSTKDLWHFLPFIINILLFSDFYLMSGPEKLDLLRNRTPYYTAIQIIGDEAVALQGITYSILILIILSKYRHEIKNFQSNIDKAVLKSLTVGTVLIFISWIIGSIAVNLELLDLFENIDFFVFVYLILVLVIYFISYVAITSPEVFKLEHRTLSIDFFTALEIVGKDPHVNTEDEKLDDINANLKEENNSLIQFMEREKPYLNSDLGLQELADKSGILRYHLSAIIKQEHKMNFYEFINSYRVEEVKRLMVEPANRNLKLISLAYDAGFNSKASFNRIFKQITGMTPSEFFYSHE